MRWWSVPLWWALWACCPAPRTTPPAPSPASPATAQPPAIDTIAMTLVESIPTGTSLGFDDVPDTAAVWPQMIARAESRLDVSQFYISSTPDGRMEPVLSAMEQAAQRGVAVRVIVDDSFAHHYPEPLARVGRFAEVRRWDVKALMGGVQHAKYFVVDGREAYVGSANFDWRALEHIHELGVHIASRALATALGALFAHDWQLAAATPSNEPPTPAAWPSVTTPDGATFRLCASPEKWLVDPTSFELPELLQLIDGATRSVVLQLLHYDAGYRDGRPFPTLDDALRRAAARGVSVRLLIADWQKSHPAALQALEREEHIDVKLVTIPPDPAGFIPFARVVHSKYLIVDGARGWIGSSNWQGDYFFNSRNVGVLLDGRIAGQLQRAFEQLWTSPYGEPVDPDAVYEKPRIGGVILPSALLARSMASSPP